MMKNLVLGCLFVLSSAAISLAQPDRPDLRRSPEERVEMMIKDLTKELNLSAAQASKIKVIELETIKKMDAIREKERNGGGRGSLREEGKTVLDAGDKKIKALLTADQAKKYTVWRAKSEEERRKRMDERREN